METPAIVSELTEKEINDGYIYLLSRYLVIQQENVDVTINQTPYNVIRHNPIGDYSFVNPNMDVAYSEGWVALDDHSYVVLTVPEIKNRYYTVQVIDCWGEVITNINEREYPQHPSGQFVFISENSELNITPEWFTIKIPGDKVKLIIRVEFQNSIEEAVRLQNEFKLESHGKITIKNPIEIPKFTNADLIKSEIFDKVEEILSSAPDTIHGAEMYQSYAKKVAAYLKSNPNSRTTINQIIRDKVIPHFLEATSGFGIQKNGWSVSYDLGRSGGDINLRAILNYGGIWGNLKTEVLYFIGLTDDKKELLHGNNTYKIHFSKEAHPNNIAKAFWSLTLYSVPDYRFAPNSINRYTLGSASTVKNNPDGSMTLWVGAEMDSEMIQDNWLPSPKGKAFMLTLRIYVPDESVLKGEWFPGGIIKL